MPSILVLAERTLVYLPGLPYAIPMPLTVLAHHATADWAQGKVQWLSSTQSLGTVHASGNLVSGILTATALLF